MKILLVGEFSRLHNSLKEGLLELGHEVLIVATGDSFKNYPVDFSIRPKFFLDYYLPKMANNLVYKIFKSDLQKTEKGVRFYFLLKNLKGFDHIQLINSDAIETHPSLGISLLKKLFRQNKNASKSLLVCGDETPVVDYLLKEELEYSVLTPFLKESSLKEQFQYTLKYTRENYRKQFEFVRDQTSSLIVSDFDYKIPMERMGYLATFIPNPINCLKISYLPIEIVPEKIAIFLGINRMNYEKKGIMYFEQALEIVKRKFPEKVEIIVAENLPYYEYIKSYNKAHIVLDMTYAMDQGYNALEAMAKGKVVFTGASREFHEYFNLTETAVIHAEPNAEKIAAQLSYLIENPSEISKIGKRARKFLEEQHDHLFIAERYLAAWNR